MSGREEQVDPRAVYSVLSDHQMQPMLKRSNLDIQNSGTLLHSCNATAIAMHTLKQECFYNPR